MQKIVTIYSAELMKLASLPEEEIELPEGGSVYLRNTATKNNENAHQPCRAIKSLAKKLDFLKTADPWDIYVINILFNEEFDWDVMQAEGLDIEQMRAVWTSMAERDLAYSETHDPTEGSIEAVQFTLENHECDEYEISRLSGCSIEVAICFASGIKFLDRIQESQEYLARTMGGLLSK